MTASASPISPAPAGPAVRRPVRGRSWTADRSPLTGFLLALPMIVLIAVFAIYPFIKLITVALGPPDGLGNIGDFFGNPGNVRALRITFVDSAIVTAVTLVVGGAVAWRLRTTQRTAIKALLWGATLLPVLMGSVVKLYALTSLLGTRRGAINGTLSSLGLTDEPLQLLYTQFAVVFGMTYQMLPFAVLPLYAAFRTIDLDLVAAAESLGARRGRALLSIVAPLSLPNVFATAALVYVVSIGFFLTPVVLGGATSPFIAALISQDVFQFFNVPAAAMGSLVLLVGGLAILIVVYRLVGRDRLTRAVAR